MISVVFIIMNIVTVGYSKIMQHRRNSLPHSLFATGLPCKGDRIPQKTLCSLGSRLKHEKKVKPKSTETTTVVFKCQSKCAHVKSRWGHGVDTCMLFTLHPSAFIDSFSWRPLWAGKLRSLYIFDKVISSILETYLRNTMWQSRLYSLTDVHIEHSYETLWTERTTPREEWTFRVSFSFYQIK